MKIFLRSVLIVAILVAVICFSSLATAATQDKNKPNIVLILADDMGADSVAALNEKCGIPTPEIDKLITQGMNFTDAHSGSAVCSPTRYGILTGRYSWRTEKKAGALGSWQPPLIEEGRLTMPEMLKQEGYETACFGKWHLGWNWAKKGGGFTQKEDEVDFNSKIRGGPTERGFDYYFGIDQPNRPPFVWIENDRTVGIPVAEGVQFAREHALAVQKMLGVPGWDLEAVLPTLTEKCVDYIKEHADGKEPYFLYFAMPSPHTPISPSKAFQGKSGINRYADFVMETDWSVGQIMKAVEESGAAEDTILIFTADNGTAKSDRAFADLRSKGVYLQHNWRGRKWDAWEGGHRVPLVVRWPAHIKPGTESNEVVTLEDLMRTSAEVTGATIPDTAAEDSVSLLPALKGGEIDSSLRKSIISCSGPGVLAIRKGKWKLQFSAGSGGMISKPRDRDLVKEVANGEVPAWQLYDLSTDPGEKKNIIETNPEMVEELTAILRQYIENGRSTPGAPQKNFNGETAWKGLPWFGAKPATDGKPSKSTSAAPEKAS